MSLHRPTPLTRRRLLAAAGAVAIGLAATACGSDDKGAAEAKASSGPWTYTDDRGTKIELKSAPTRVVTYVGAAAALHDFGIDKQIVGVYGPAKKKDGTPDAQIGGFDPDKATIIGNAYGEFDIEKYAALRPELLVDHMFVKPNLFYVPAESKDKIFKLAPSVGVATGEAPLPTPIEHYAKLAQALGADLDSDKVKADKARFDKAAAGLKAAAAAKPGLKVLAASGSADLFYASNPGKNSDLMYFKQLGVDIIVPDKLDKDDYFEGLSWENADKYKADLILLDARTQALQPKDLESKPTWKDLPAVKADQVISWQAEPVFSYAGAAPILENLTKAIQNAKKVS
ncbi:ABC transporter substrate-binding protein [Actinomadura parmotrematis]|uniref:ABC transporter substrate-binding protein n=1 Tax=Actinomadura parmotrematis TaxID=2864039 RepID=A0ABS7FSU1_9ACTN|nr:ABC transporter substrate-binding protein [Actinomadura parmotrematis]MBW8483457.1 ABC transporter substrate-binding protein [Actinomadura parmotrematis]